jgi:hypothetical protein
MPFHDPSIHFSFATSSLVNLFDGGGTVFASDAFDAFPLEIPDEFVAGAFARFPELPPQAANTVHPKRNKIFKCFIPRLYRTERGHSELCRGRAFRTVKAKKSRHRDDGIFPLRRPDVCLMLKKQSAKHTQDRDLKTMMG